MHQMPTKDTTECSGTDESFGTIQLRLASVLTKAGLNPDLGAQLAANGCLV
jgi:hypothetical protein